MLSESEHREINLRVLASRAGITAGSMYHHFESKAELLAMLASVGFNDLRRRLESCSQAAVTQDRLRGWAREYTKFAAGEPALFMLMFSSEVAHFPQVVEAREALIGHLRAIVSDMADQFDVGKPYLDEMTIAVWAAAHGGATLGMNLGGSSVIEDVMTGLEAVFIPRRRMDIQNR
jgi:AcrR family transcriptional regulator